MMYFYIDVILSFLHKQSRQIVMKYHLLFSFTVTPTFEHTFLVFQHLSY